MRARTAVSVYSRVPYRQWPTACLLDAYVCRPDDAIALNAINRRNVFDSYRNAAIFRRVGFNTVTSFLPGWTVLRFVPPGHFDSTRSPTGFSEFWVRKYSRKCRRIRALVTTGECFSLTVNLLRPRRI